MKKGNNNDMGKEKQEQNKGDIRTMTQLGKKASARIRALVKLKPEATARPAWKRGHYNGTTNLKRNTRTKTNGNRRTKVLKWKSGKIKKIGKYMSEGEQVTERVEDLKQRQRKEKGKTEKREIKLAKEGTMKETMCQTQ